MLRDNQRQVVTSPPEAVNINIPIPSRPSTVHRNRDGEIAVRCCSHSTFSSQVALVVHQSIQTAMLLASDFPLVSVTTFLDMSCHSQRGFSS